MATSLQERHAQVRSPQQRHRTERRAGARPPAVILGGGVNALSVARSLGRRGIAVYILNDPAELVHYSRFARSISLPSGLDDPGTWRDYLLGAKSDHLRDAVLLAASDAGLKLILENREALARKYRLDDSNPIAQRCMLNKLDTYQAAAAAGVPTPRFWQVCGVEDIDRLRAELVFPLIVKPQLSHVFESRFGTKFFIAEDYRQLVDAFTVTSQAGIEALLMERIPGPDDLLCSYYTYLDENSDPLFHFTKRIIRRFPLNMGGACYHITDDNPEVRELGLKLFRHVGLRGLANVEFKRDPRDGRLKLIECNARFTAANCLVATCGFDLAEFVYNRAVGLPLPEMTAYRTGVRLWNPIDDFKAFRALRRRGELTLRQWIRSILHRQTFPVFKWTDPWPSAVGLFRRVKRLALKRDRQE